MARLPQTRAEVFYSYEIQIGNIPVGTLRNFTPRQTRTHEHVREIATNGGEITEIVPGVPTYQVTMNKVRLYEDTLLDFFGIVSQDIQKQVRAINVIETVWKPTNVPNNQVTGPATADTAGTRLRTQTYEDCWVVEWGKTISSEGLLIVEDMTVQSTRVI